MPILLAVSGAFGRMGRHVVRLAAGDERFELAALLEGEGHPGLGAAPPGAPAALAATGSLAAKIDVMIDFSSPAGFRQRLLECVGARAAFVSGTTGLAADDEDLLVDASSVIPLLHASNLSLGVQVLCRAAEAAARALGEGFDVEVVEVHHRAKVDAPSGTALEIARVIAGAKSGGTEQVFGRRGRSGPRRREEIGVHAVRGGDVVGEHSVLFLGQGERVELLHRCTDREVFARGALHAAALIAGRPPGRVRLSDLI